VLSTLLTWMVYDPSSVPATAGTKFICAPPVIEVTVDLPNAASRITPAFFVSSSIFVVRVPCPDGRNRRDAR
jgi:hypothetical protein